ncbi:MAG: helix-hairpin-helix domain-containing protein [Microbacter sp.]
MFVRNLMILCALVVSSLPLSTHAQNKENTTENVIARIVEEMSANSEENIDYTTLEEDLNYFAENPINLNNTTKETLQKLQFLSDQQIENLLYYLYRNRPMHSIYELQLVEGFDEFTIQNLLPFVYVGNMAATPTKIPSLKTILKHGKNEWIGRFDRTLEQKAGFVSTLNDSLAYATNKKYLGDPNYYAMRYSFRYRDQINAGITSEKDPGEQFWGSAHKGFDFYSAFLELNHFGALQTLVAGNFRANFGQGLVLHPEMTYGKTNDVLNVLPQNGGLHKCSSSDEYNYLRGIGLTFGFNHTEVSAFYSFRFLDGDTTGAVVATIRQDGYHRTQAEVATKNTIGFQVIGGNIQWHFSQLRAGITFNDTRLGLAYQPKKEAYRYFSFSGKHQWVGGINYQYHWLSLRFFGETALTDRKAMATIDGCSFSPTSRTQIIVLYRNYSSRYSVLLANSFAESGSIQNEEGFYMGIVTNPIKHWQFSMATDSYRFPWLTYSVSKPAAGYDFLFTAHYLSSSSLDLFWKIRYRQKEKNEPTTETTYFTGKHSTTNFYFSMTYSLNRQFSLKNIIAVNLAQDEQTPLHAGYIMTQDFTWTPTRFPLVINVRYAFFDAPQYDTRFYLYEKDLLYVFSIPMLYGKGSRAYLNLHYDFNRRLSFWLKAAQTFYEDVSSIGSGLDLIAHNHRTDIRGMVRIKF